MQKANLYQVTSRPEFKGELSALDLLGVYKVLELAFGSKGKKNAEKFSSVQTDLDQGATLNLHSEGTSFQLTVKYFTEYNPNDDEWKTDYTVIQCLKVTNNGSLYALGYTSNNDELYLRFELEKLL